MKRSTKISLLFGLTLFCLTLLLPTSASAQTQEICVGTNIPAGWVVTNITAQSFRCGVNQQPTIGGLIYNIWTIENIASYYVGTRVLACDTSASPTPSDWVVIERQAVSFRCGVGQQPTIGGQVINVKVIERVSGPVRPTPTPTPTPTPNPNLNSRVFDAQWYLGLNPDVANAYGINNLEAAKAHWLSVGLNEGRVALPTFSVREYLARNADLQAAFGNNYQAATNHWLSSGLNEGRRASLVFDVKYYLSQNADVRNVYGATGYIGATSHWLSSGLNEGRRGSANFDPVYYMANNPDVAALYGATNYRWGLIHWLVSGRSEGRLGAP